MSGLKIDCSSLPLYTPSAPSPRYSCEPACDEQRLQHTPRFNRTPPTGMFVQQSGKVIVTLFEQEDDAKIPTYGRHGLVSGTIYLQKCETISHVSLKIEGRLESTVSEGGSNSVRLVNDCYTLWRGKTEESPCPGFLSFSVILPSTYVHGDVKTPLPPSYISCHRGYPSFFVKSHYNIRIYIKRVRHRKLDFLTKTKRINIPFIYSPRTRAHRPIIPSPCFFSTVKTSPEEWYQVFSILKTRPQTQWEPIHCHLFIPGGRVYGLSDTIPFHVQVNGPVSTLRKFLMLYPLDEPTIKVYLLRQISVETKSNKVWRNMTLAQGRLSEVPPVASCTPCEYKDTSHLDWEGELEFPRDVSVGGFVAGNVAVKDFVVLEVEPPNKDSKSSPFFALQITVPIRLVTESYAEETDYVGLT